VAYATIATGEGHGTGLSQSTLTFTTQQNNSIASTIDSINNTISSDTPLNGVALKPVKIWRKVKDAEISVEKSTTTTITLYTDQTYTMTILTNGTSTNIIGTTQTISPGFMLPPYTDQVLENSYYFQWQMSTDDTGWYDIIGANNSSYQITYGSNTVLNQIYYFRCLFYKPSNKNSYGITSVIPIIFEERPTE
jgi:hypothetical protein